MSNLERGMVIFGIALVCIALVAVWCASAYDVFKMKHSSNPVLSLAIFLTPFFYGLCWLLGWATS